MTKSRSSGVEYPSAAFEVLCDLFEEKMQPNDRLDYAIFQLTPTRTRCELLVAAQGLTYKLASGLLKPFVSHLQAAEEQLARGGYSIRLEPPDPAPWFTKGTMERFVRFVSTPEVLERVSTIQVEISEIENTISAQSTEANEANDGMQADDQSNKSVGGRTTAYVSLEKSSKSADCADNGVEESSKQRLLRALNARRTMLQKEQGMAFARAIAAGFSIEQMDDLVVFAECFGATRLREACKKFMALCKKRQEAGLWLEDLDLAASGNYHHEMAFISGAHEVAMAWEEQRREVDAEQQLVDDGPEKLTKRASLDPTTGEYMKGTANGNAGTEMDHRDLDTARGIGLVRGHPMMSSWPGQQIPSQFLAHGGMRPTMSMAYPFPGATTTGAMPYPPYLGATYMHSPYGDAMAWQGAMGPTHPMVPSQYWQGSQGYGNNSGPFASEAPSPPIGVVMSSGQHPPNMSSLKQSSGFNSQPSLATDGQDNGEYRDSTSDVDAEAPLETTRRLPRRSASPSRRSASPMRKVQIGRSGNRQSSGMVVIRNINYITPTSQGQTKGDGEGGSSGSWSEEEGRKSWDDRDEVKSDTGRLNLHDVIGLLESKKARSNKRLSKTEARKLSRNADLDNDNVVNLGEATSTQRELFPDEASTMMERNKLGSEQARAGDLGIDAETGVQPKKGAVGAQMSDDMCMGSENQRRMQHNSEFIADQEKQDGKKPPLVDESFMDSYHINIKRTTELVDSGYEFSGKSAEDLKQQKLENIPSDDSFMIVDRSAIQEAKDMSWVPFNPESENLHTSDRDHTQETERFEPIDLLMVPEGNRMSAIKSWNASHDDMQMFAAEMMEGQQIDQDNADHEETELVSSALEQEEENLGEKTRATSTKEVSERAAKAKAMQEMLERRKRSAGRKTDPLIEAQQRAEKLRMFKAGLRKSKHEKEEEERKRIEDLRRQRQERIAARSNPGGVVQSPSSKAGVANKSSPSALNKSLSPNLAHSERHQTVKAHISPGSLSNIQKASLHGNKVSRPPLSSPKVVGSAVSRSVPSLAELRKESSKSSSSLPAVHSSTKSTCASVPMRSAVSCSLPSLGDLRKESSKSVSLAPVVHSNATMEQKKHLMTSEGELASPLSTKLEVHSEGKKHLMLSAARKVLSPPKEPKDESLPSTKVVKVQPSPASKPQRKLASVKEAPSMPLHDGSGIVSLKGSPVQELPKGNEIVRRPRSSFPAAEVSAVPESNGDTHSSTGMVKTVVEDTGNISDHDDVVKGVENSKENFVGGSSLHLDSQSGSDDGHVEPEVGVSTYEDHATLMVNTTLVDDGSTVSLDDANGASVPIGLPSTLPSIAEKNELPALDSPHLYTPESLPCLLDAIQQPLSPDVSPLHLASAKARKKWGEKTPKEHAKGLKRLLLLGRKSSKNSTQNCTLSSTDGVLNTMVSEGDEYVSKERGLTSSMGGNVACYVDSAESLVKVHGENGSGISSKGSRSFFSLSNFRGRTEAKAKA